MPIRTVTIKNKISVGEDGEEQLVLLCTVGGDVNWCSHLGKQYGSASNN